MKINRTVIIFSFLMLSFVETNAQSKWSFNMGAGVNFNLYNNDYLRDPGGSDGSSKLGEYRIGGYYKKNTVGYNFISEVGFNIFDNFEISTGLFFIYRSLAEVSEKDSGLKYSSEINPTYKNEEDEYILQIPLILSYRIKDFDVMLGIKQHVYSYINSEFTFVLDNTINYKWDGFFNNKTYFSIGARYNYELKKNSIGFFIGYDFKPKDEYHSIIVQVQYSI